MSARYLLAGLTLVLLVVGAGVAFAYGQEISTAGENGAGSATEGNGMSSMVGGGGMMGGDGRGSMMDVGQTTGPFDERQPFDLQFIDQMTVHHEGAIMSSEHMISDSKRPELRELAENIRESQSEQKMQMQAWRDEWYLDAGQTSGMHAGTMDEMMGDGMMEQMMGGSMQEVMGGDATDEMFLRMMIPHHQMAVDMGERALEQAEHPELKELAQKIIDEQSAEIELMRGYLEEIEA